MFGTDPVDQVLELLGDLAGEDRRDWAGAARSERVVGLARIVERAQADLVGATAEWDGQLDWTADGACSPATWLARHAPVSKGKADRLVRCARLVRRHDRTAKALAAGDLSSQHLEVLADTTRRREDLYADHEDVLLDAAAALDVDDFRTAAESWRQHADAVRANREAFDSRRACERPPVVDVRRPRHPRRRTRPRRRRDPARRPRRPHPPRPRRHRPPAPHPVGTARRRAGRDGRRIPRPHLTRRARTRRRRRHHRPRHPPRRAPRRPHPDPLRTRRRHADHHRDRAPAVLRRRRSVACS